METVVFTLEHGTVSDFFDHFDIAGALFFILVEIFTIIIPVVVFVENQSGRSRCGCRRVRYDRFGTVNLHYTDTDARLVGQHFHGRGCESHLAKSSHPASMQTR